MKNKSSNLNLSSKFLIFTFISLAVVILAICPLAKFAYGIDSPSENSDGQIHRNLSFKDVDPNLVVNDSGQGRLYSTPNDTPPATGDSRTNGPGLPAVRDQDVYGTCGSFAAMAAIESSLLRQNSALSKNTIDLSERHLAYFFFNRGGIADPLGLITNKYNQCSNGVSKDQSGQQQSYVNTYLDFGNNNISPIFTLASGNGIANESTAKYSDIMYQQSQLGNLKNLMLYIDQYHVSFPNQGYDSWESINNTFLNQLPNYNLNSSSAFGSDTYHVQDADIIPFYKNGQQNFDQVKKAIIQNGAVASSYNHSDAKFNPANNAYYDPESTNSNHAIAIVGWNDNFSASNFNNDNLTQNGAGLIRNSGGPNAEYHDGGYFGMSYYNRTFTSSSTVAVAYKAESTSNYDNNYQHDGNGSVARTGDGSKLNYGDSVANVYTANASDAEEIDAVSIAVNSTSSNWDIQIYKNLTDPNDPASGEACFAYPQNVSFDTAGYHTVKLSTPVTINKGKSFSVVFTAKQSGLSLYMETNDINNPTGEFNYHSDIKTGESFIKLGTSWIDLGSGTNKMCARVKAFTKNVEFDPCPHPYVASIASGYVKLKGDAIPNAEKYGVSEYINGRFINYKLDIQPDETQFEISNLANGMTHVFLVQAYVGGRGSTYSDSSKYVSASLTDPSYPTKPKITNVEVVGTSFTVTGDTCPGISGYAVSTSYGNRGGVNHTLSCKSNQYTIYGLNEDTTYNIVITANINGGGTTFDSSDIGQKTTDGISPKTVSATDVSSGTIEVSGEAVPNVTWYGVSRVLDNGGFINYDLMVDPSKTSLEISDLPNGYTYKFLVQAYVGGRGSTYSDSSKYVSASLTDPLYPTKPIITDVSVSGTNITVTGETCPGTSGYAVSTSYGNHGWVNHTLSCKINQYTISGLNIDTTYNIVITANINGSGTPFTSDDIGQKTTDGISPKNVSAEALSSGTISLSGDPVNSASCYGVSRVLDNGGFQNYNLEIDSDTTTYEIGNLPNGYTYTFLVQAFVDGRWSTYSNSTKYVSADLTDPLYPTKPKITNVEVVGTSFKVTGDTCPGTSGYAVSTSYGSHGWVNHTLSCKTNQYTISGLNIDTTYNIVITASINGGGTPFTSDDIGQKTTDGISPKNVSAEVVPSDKIKISGDFVPNATGYGVSRVLDNGGFINYDLKVDPSKTSFEITNLPGGHTYSFLVQAFVGGRGSTYSNPTKYVSVYLP